MYPVDVARWTLRRFRRRLRGWLAAGGGDDPDGVRVWLATAHTDMRKDFDGLALLVQETLKQDPHSGHLFVFRGHSAYRFRFATIAYHWHPLFGRKLQVSPFRRGKELTCIYTNERPDLCRELPNWMFDESYCAGMTLGPPEISIEGLNELASVLASSGANWKRGAQSHPSRTKEVDCAKKPAPQSGTARSRAGSSDSDNTRGEKHKGAGRSLGRSSAGGAGHRDEAGRRR